MRKIGWAVLGVRRGVMPMVISHSALELDAGRARDAEMGCFRVLPGIEH